MRKIEDRPLSCRVVGRRLVIEIGIRTLAFAAPDNDPWVVWDDARNDYRRRFKVTDPTGFAADIARELEREEEDGSTPLHGLVDKAAVAALENGSLAVEECDERFVPAAAPSTVGLAGADTVARDPQGDSGPMTEA